MSFRKIVVATDFSPGSAGAVSFAMRLADRYGAELVIAHAWEVPTTFAGALPAPTDVVDDVRGDAARALEDAVRDARARGATRLSSRLLEGAAAASLLRLAESSDMDLVVVGTRGRTGLPRVVLGSVAETIVRGAPCSVLVVRGDSDATRLSHILCPIERDKSSKAALRLAANLVRANDAKLTLLNVVAPLTIVYSGQRAVRYLCDLDRISREWLQTTAAEVSAASPVSIDTRSAMGSPGGQILALLDEDPTIDIVVMGSHGRSGIKHAVLGSVAEKVVRYARCPVLIARERHLVAAA